jgi:hypothetical protein
MADDFSTLVKKALADRVGHRCSKPDCRALTTGPQDDPGKSVNLGVAAHITAASPGGPRYDPDLLPEERSASSNGIWLCQNCAKLVDNDVLRFPENVLRQWKTEAESDTKSRLGKTAISSNSTNDPGLKVYDKVRISPIVPRVHEQSDFYLQEDTGPLYVFKKQDSLRSVEIPKSFIGSVHIMGDGRPAILRLKGRLQWVSPKRMFDLFVDPPPAGSLGAYGIAKDVDLDYPRRAGIQGVSFAREERLPQLLIQGWYVYYDTDGAYLRNPGRDANQILICNWT